jgi:hypothetical protein
MGYLILYVNLPKNNSKSNIVSWQVSKEACVWTGGLRRFRIGVKI